MLHVGYVTMWHCTWGMLLHWLVFLTRHEATLSSPHTIFPSYQTHSLQMAAHGLPHAVQQAHLLCICMWLDFLPIRHAELIPDGCSWLSTHSTARSFVVYLRVAGIVFLSWLVMFQPFRNFVFLSTNLILIVNGFPLLSKLLFWNCCFSFMGGPGPTFVLVILCSKNGWSGGSL